MSTASEKTSSKSPLKSKKNAPAPKPVTTSKTVTDMPLGAFYSAGVATGLATSPMQAKFTIGKTGDPFEREADVAADHVMSGRPVPSITPVPAAGLGSIAKMEDEEETETEAPEEREQPRLVQRKPELVQKEQSTQGRSGDLVEEPDPAQSEALQTVLIQTELEEAEFGESGAQPMLVQRQEGDQDEGHESVTEQPRLIQREIEASETEAAEDEGQPMLIQRMCSNCEKESADQSDTTQTQSIQNQPIQKQDGGEQEQVDPEISGQPLLLQRQSSEVNNATDQTEEIPNQPRLIQREAEEEPENENAAPPQPRLIQREANDENETPQTKRIQRAAVATEKEEETLQANPVQREAEDEPDNENPPQTRLIQREADTAETEDENPQPMLLQREALDETENQESPLQTRLIQRESEDENEQPMLLQREAEEEETVPEAEPQPRLIQRQEEAAPAAEDQPEEGDNQPMLLQRKCAGCEKEAQQDTVQEENTAPQAKLMVQRSVQFPAVPSAEKEGEEELAEEAIEEEEEPQEGEGEGEEAEGIDPPLEPYEPVEKTPPPPVQTKRNGSQPGAHRSLEHNLNSSSGRSLDSPLQQEMEGRFGRDLSGVRIHTDGNAQQMNRQLGARAFTRANHIFFNAGQYQPESAHGKHLLAHELTHTMQQGAVSNTVQRWEEADQDVTTDPPAKQPNDGNEVKGRMNKKIDDETDKKDPDDMSEEELRKAKNPDRSKRKRESSALKNSGQASPSIDRGAAAQEKTAGQKQLIEQQVAEPTPEAARPGSEGGEEKAQLSDAEAAAQRAEEAENNARGVQIPARPQPFSHPRIEAPVDSKGEPLPRQAAMDTRVRGLGYIGEMLREKGYEMKRAAAEQEVGSYGHDATLEKLREDLANSVEGTNLMKTHNEERKTILESSRLAHKESVERQTFVAKKAPDLAAKADEGQKDSGALAADARKKADKAKKEIPDDDDARADAEKQSGDMNNTSEGAVSMDDAVSKTGQRARQYERDAATAAQENQKSDKDISETESKIGETDTRLEEMSATNDASKEKIENTGPGPALIRENASQTAQSGDQLIAATIVMELELNALQEEYLASAKALESREEAEERVRKEQEQKAKEPEQSPIQAAIIALGLASEEEQEEIIADMSQQEREEMAREIERQPTAEEAAAQQAQQALTPPGGDKQDPNADPRAPQIGTIDERRKQRVEGMLNVADVNMTYLTAAQQKILANRLVAESVGDDIKNINVLQMGKMMLEGMVNPMLAIKGVWDGFKKIGSGISAAFSADAWKKDPLGNLLKVAASISTGLAMVFSSVLGLATLIVAAMVILTILSWGTMSWFTGPVIGWMGTIMTYAGWGAIISGGLSVYFNYLSYIKNLNDAATAPTARELFKNTDEMKQNVTDGFQGAMAIVEGVGAVKMGPRLSSGKHFSRVPRSPKEALSRVGKGVKRGAAGLAAMPGRIGRGLKDLFKGGKRGLARLKERLRSVARRGDRPPGRADIPGDVKVKAPRDGNLGSFDGKKVRAEVDLPNNQRMRVLEDGRCVVCASPCKYVGHNYAKELAADPRTAQRLQRIERSLAKNPNQPRVIQAHRGIQLELRNARINKPKNLRSKYAGELADNPGLARQLNELEPRIKSKPTNRKHQRRVESIEKQLRDQRRRVSEARGGKQAAKELGFPDKPPKGYEWYSGPDGRPRVRKTKGNSGGPRREFDPDVPATRKDGTPRPLEERFPVRPAKKITKRRQYLGDTPGKRSATGKKVIDKMRNETPPRVKGKAPNEQVFVKGPPDPIKKRWYKIDEMDMGHHPVDAVKYWNDKGIKLGPKHPEVRKWMLDPDNYELQHRSVNRSEGSKVGQTAEGRYKDPP